MWTYNAMGTCVLVLTLATIFVAVLVVHKQRAQKDIGIWLLSGLVGILLGASGAAATVQIMGYDLTIAYHLSDELAAAEGDGDGEEPAYRMRRAHRGCQRRIPGLGPGRLLQGTLERQRARKLRSVLGEVAQGRSALRVLGDGCRL